MGSNAVISNNLAAGNSSGFSVGGAGNLVKDNRALNNDYGFLATPRFEQNTGNPLVFNGNVAEGNEVGFLVAGPFEGDIRIVGNALLGNTSAGLVIDLDEQVTLRISENNFYGNNVIPDSRFLTPTPLVNCGLANIGINTVTATNSFWGAATGPGADPADDVCDHSTGDTIVVPFSTHEFKLGASAF